MDILNEFLGDSKQKAIQDYNHFKSLVTWLEEDGKHPHRERTR